MEKIQTITVNGSAYTIEDPGAARIDDSRVGDTAWSSRQILDRLCPAFSQSGATVTCRPAEGYPLGVVSYIQPALAGSPEPSPDNIRPISGWDTVTLTFAGANARVTRTADLGQTVYGGSYDWTGGVLTIDQVRWTLTGEESWSRVNSTNPNGSVFGTTAVPKKLKTFTYNSEFGSMRGASSHFCRASHSLAASAPSNSFYWTTDGTGFRICWGLPNGGTSVEEFKQFLAQQQEKGTPVECVCQMESPVTVRLTPLEILALAGSNTLSSDTGDTQVTGRLDPMPLLQQLAEK